MPAAASATRVDPHIGPWYPKSSRITYRYGKASLTVFCRLMPRCGLRPWRRGLLRRGDFGVDRFVSHYTNRLDAKGRISLPAAFRAVLAQDGFEGLCLHPSLDQQALDCGGNGLLKEIDGYLERFAPCSEEWDLFSTAFLGTSEILKVDPEGRILLTESLKAFAGVTGEVTFVGQGYKFQIWEPSRFREHLSEARRRVRDLRRELPRPEIFSMAPRGAAE